MSETVDLINGLDIPSVVPIEVRPFWESATHLKTLAQFRGHSVAMLRVAQRYHSQIQAVAELHDHQLNLTEHNFGSVSSPSFLAWINSEQRQGQSRTNSETLEEILENRGSRPPAEVILSPGVEAALDNLGRRAWQMLQDATRTLMLGLPYQDLVEKLRACGLEFNHHGSRIIRFRLKCADGSEFGRTRQEIREIVRNSPTSPRIAYTRCDFNSTGTHYLLCDLVTNGKDTPAIQLDCPIGDHVR